MYSMEREVNCSDIGMNGLIRNSAAVDYLQDCSVRHLDNHPVLAPFFAENNCIMFLVSRQIDILRLPKYPEKISVKTWCYELKRLYGYRNTVIYDESGEPIVKSIACGAFMNAETAHTMKCPQELVDRVKKYPKEDMEYLPRKITLPDTTPEVYPTVPILRHYIDMNKHVNNARYLDITDEFLPIDAQIGRIRAEYKLPVKLGDVITPKVYRLGSVGAVELCVDDRCATIVEYTLK